MRLVTGGNIDWMPRSERPSGTVWADAVSGAMPSGDRAVRLDRLRQAEQDERGVLCNARCLGDGVDIPTLDGVAFIDPKHSQVDIVQAVGRAIRKGEGKGTATIVIPVFVDTEADPEDALDRSAFMAIAGVLRALRDHDETLAEELDALRRELGLRSRRRPRLPRKIVLDLPKNVRSEFSAAISTQVVQLTTASWEEWFARLQQYVKSHGNARMSQRYITPDGYRLGGWVNIQRTRKDQLSPERQTRLESLDGWVWDALDALWEDMFTQLQEFAEQKGHVRVPQSYRTPDGSGLRSWVNHQRMTKGELSSDRRRRLEARPDWSWHPHDSAWENFSRLQQFVEREGHARVPLTYITPDGHELGTWVGTQRSRKDTMLSERRIRLESLDGWMWDPFNEEWEGRFAQLQQYVKVHGHSRVPSVYTTSDGFGLGMWVARHRYELKKLSADRRTRLEALTGWVWGAKDALWEEGFAQLQQYVKTHGNAGVPSPYATPDGYRFGSWVGTQRARRARLSQGKETRLEALDGWVWDVLDAAWDEGFTHLQEYVAEHGHARVPSVYTTSDGFGLGMWVSGQRTQKDRLSSERQARLESLDIWAWNVLEAKWQEQYSRLQQYVRTHGYASVLQSYTTTEGHRLGAWVNMQRMKKKKLSPERRKRLEALPGWVWSGK